MPQISLIHITMLLHFEYKIAYLGSMNRRFFINTAPYHNDFILIGLGRGGSKLITILSRLSPINVRASSPPIVVIVVVVVVVVAVQWECLGEETPPGRDNNFHFYKLTK